MRKVLTHLPKPCAYKPCSRMFRRPPSADGLYCSAVCAQAAQRQLPSAMCAWCGQAFAPRPSRVAMGEDRFCSRDCGFASRQRTVIVFCAYCGIDVPVIPSRIGKAEFITCSKVCKESYEAQQQLAHFWDNVDQSGGPDACWPWMGGRTKDDNYGRFHLCGKTYGAHRIAFILVNGLLLPGEEALHRCDNPPCCNPSHLFKGTKLDNVRDRDTKGRQAKGDHVPYEHRSRGTGHHTAKLTDITARECYALKGTMSQQRAGDLFDIHQTVVSDLWNRKIWQHIHVTH